MTLQLGKGSELWIETNLARGSSLLTIITREKDTNVKMVYLRYNWLAFVAVKDNPVMG